MIRDRRKRRRKMPDPLAGDPFSDDRGYDKKKLRQLCRQVERALSTAFDDDDRLLDLQVQGVLPWPNASRLLVAVYPSEPGAEVDREAILARLEEAQAELRELAAGAVHRKRAPGLCFEIIPMREL